MHELVANAFMCFQRMINFFFAIIVVFLFSAIIILQRYSFYQLGNVKSTNTHISGQMPECIDYCDRISNALFSIKEVTRY